MCVDEFNISDTVRIKKDSEYYDCGYANPANLHGKVKAIDLGLSRHFSIIVRWENGTENCYSANDLEKVS